MARYPYQNTTKDGSGKVICSAIVAVFLTGTSTPASIYAASAGGVAVNSVTSGSDTSSSPGYFIFWIDRDNYAASQEFDITISKSGFNTQTYSFIVIDNAADYASLDHKASHENGGAYEISVAGLSGLLADKQHVLDAEVINLVYPVGSIYVSIIATNPGTLFGVGTWSAFGAGRVLVGLDAGQAEFDTVEETGGAKTVSVAHTHTGPSHTHTGPSHNHKWYEQNAASVSDQSYNTSGNAINIGIATPKDIGIKSLLPVATSDYPDADMFTNNAGTGATGAEGTGATGAMSANETPSTLQPYIVVYFWKRTV